MIVLGAILLILGLLLGISILTYIGVVLLVIGAVFWILGGCGPSGGRPKGLVLAAQSHSRPAEVSAATVMVLKTVRELASAAFVIPGFTLCDVEFNNPNVA